MNLDPRVFPTILMVLDFIAAIPYAVQGDVRHTLRRARGCSPCRVLGGCG